MFRVDSGANLLNFSKMLKYWCPKVFFNSGGPRQSESYKLLSNNIFLLHLVLHVKLYCKCSTLKLEVKQLLPVSGKIFAPSPKFIFFPQYWKLSAKTNQQEKTLLLDNLYSCVIMLAMGTFGSQIWLLN